MNLRRYYEKASGQELPEYLLKILKKDNLGNNLRNLERIQKIIWEKFLREILERNLGENYKEKLENKHLEKSRKELHEKNFPRNVNVLWKRQKEF